MGAKAARPPNTSEKAGHSTPGYSTYCPRPPKFQSIQWIGGQVHASPFPITEVRFCIYLFFIVIVLPQQFLFLQSKDQHSAEVACIAGG